MKKVIAALALVLVLTGCNYRDVVLNHVGADDPAYTTPSCSSYRHNALAAHGVDAPCP